MKSLKLLRESKDLTQEQAAKMLGVSLRSYKSYENESKKEGTLKYNYFVSELEKINPIDEDHGILTLERIKTTCSKVFEQYKVQYAYLFGSYAKGNAKPSSDVDLLVATDVTGIKFFGLVEELRSGLSKKVDVLDIAQLKGNFELTNEILASGVKIYG